MPESNPNFKGTCVLIREYDVFGEVKNSLPDGSRVAMPGVTPKLSETPAQVTWIGPQLGAHTDEVLAEPGYEANSIKKLRATGVV